MTYANEVLRKNKLSTTLVFRPNLFTFKALMTEFPLFVDNSVHFPLGRHHFLLLYLSQLYDCVYSSTGNISSFVSCRPKLANKSEDIFFCFFSIPFFFR